MDFEFGRSDKAEAFFNEHPNFRDAFEKLMNVSIRCFGRTASAVLLLVLQEQNELFKLGLEQELEAAEKAIAEEWFPKSKTIACREL